MPLLPEYHEDDPLNASRGIIFGFILFLAFLFICLGLYLLIPDSVEFPPRSSKVYTTIPFSQTEARLKECKGCHNP